MFLARKITRAKWEHTTINAGRIPADAVPADLRTRNNALSFWRCGSASDEELDDAVLALAASSTRLDKIDLVWVSEADLQADGQELVDTKGQTPVQDLIEKHVDAQQLDYERLGKIAAKVALAINGCRFRRVSKQRVKSLLAKAMERQRVEITELGGVASELNN